MSSGGVIELPTIVLGDWSSSNMKHVISTPNKRVKELLSRSFKVYLIDEFRTSCLHNGTKQKGDNLMYVDKTGKWRKLHSVLTFQLLKGMGCINRDRNACLNMLNLTLLGYWRMDRRV